MRAPTSQLSLTREEYLQPHFEAPTATMKSYDFDFERIVECAKSVTGECPIDEMTQMMEGKASRFSCFLIESNRRKTTISTGTNQCGVS